VGDNPPRLAARGLGWAAGERWILLDLDLSLQAGSLAWLRGANGSGKTTLLDLLAGERRPTRGSVLLDGVPLSEVQPAHLARRLGVLGHRPGLYGTLTAVENVQLFAALAGADDGARAARRALDRAGLDGSDHHRPVATFSRGMAQRTGLARLLACGADVWLLDEPGTGLDPDGRERLAEVIDDAVRGGVTAVVVSHHDHFARLASRRLALQAGGLVSLADQGAST
jgi:heme ABC exporter ATP-binding subunit CcmA